MTAALHAPTDLAHANGIRILQDDREAFQARTDLIQQASTQICLAYFAVDKSEAPIALMELLRQASQRGVVVRLLVDDLFSRLPSEFECFLRNSGVQMRVYHRLKRGHPKWFSRRLHDKLMIVDSHHLIIGSRNLRNDHFGMADKNYIDCDAYLFGDIAGQSQTYFDWLWSSADVRAPSDTNPIGLDVLRYRPTGKDCWSEAWRQADRPSQYQSLLDESVRRVVCRLGVQLDSGNDWSAGATQPIKARLLHDCRTDKSDQQMHRGIVKLIDSACSSLLIESPYPAFSKQTRAAVTRASDRGVRVSILTNSLKSTDRLSVFAAYQNDKRRLLKHGVALHEYCGEGCLHSKLMLIDDCTCMIGSYNFDSRSDHYNLEICVVVCDAATAGMLKKSIAGRMSKSRKIADHSLLLDMVGGEDMLRRLRLMLKRTSVEFYRQLL
jgi:putative cardiolipin synthase